MMTTDRTVNTEAQRETREGGDVWFLICARSFLFSQTEPQGVQQVRTTSFLQLLSRCSGPRVTRPADPVSVLVQTILPRTCGHHIEGNTQPHGKVCVCVCAAGDGPNGSELT